MQNEQLEQSCSEHEDNQVEQQINKQQCITDPQQFLALCLKDKKIKVMDECNPIWNNVYLKDISLHKKGPLQDKIYSKVNTYYRNIRRGNTLCQIYHQQQLNTQPTYNLFFCRRGMKKFYDLEPEYLRVAANLSTHHRLVRNRIFEELDQEIERGNAQIHIYRLFKQNGEHCQVSYVRELDCWLFASKNVAILARNKEDLENHYHKQRFYWAKLIGEEFFNILDKFKPEQIQQFKKDIHGFTLLGEHCGNTEHQHITKYDKVQIIFYGLVNNIGADHCQPVEECRAFLNKYGLTMSACKERKNISDKNKIYASMWEMLKEVGEGTMAVEGEGSVMYIVAEREGKQRTIAMCKLKTSEYLIYRRLREMLKLNVSRKGSTANNFQKYQFQIQEMVKHYFKPPKPVRFYLQIGQRAFREVDNNSSIDEQYLRYKFVDFIQQIEQDSSKINISQQKSKAKSILFVGLPRLTNLVQKYCKSQAFDIDYMYRAGKAPFKTIVHILYMIPRLPAKLDDDTMLIIGDYDNQAVSNCIEQLQNTNDISKSHLISFVKSQDKSKNIKMLHQKIVAFTNSCKTNGVNFKTVKVTADQDIIAQIQSCTHNNAQNQLQKQPTKLNVIKKYVIIPMLIPGSGKSTLAKQIFYSKQSQIKWKTIDTDSIRRQFMQRVGEVDLDCSSSQQLYIKAKEQTNEEFQQKLITQIQIPPNDKHQCIYLDRLFSPSNMQETLNLVQSANRQYVQIIVITQTNNSVRLNDTQYPYSLNYALSCLKRCLQRQQHQTMSNNPYDVAKIVLRFYQMLGNFNQKTITKTYPNVKFISIPIVVEREENQFVNQHLKRKMEECLLLVEPGKHAKDSHAFVELVELLYKFGQFKQEPSLDCYSTLLSDLQANILAN